MMFPIIFHCCMDYYENFIISPNKRVQIKKLLFAFLIKMGKFLKINFSSELKGL